jgi:TonB family protein
LSQLAAGDGGAAETSFGKARKADDSGLSDLLEQLTQAYVAFNLTTEPHPKRSLKANEDLDYANRSFYKRHIPPAVLQEALERTRKLLKATPAMGSPDLLHPLLCNLRLLARDRATDGEPVLETTSRDVGSLVPPKPVFAPLPPYTEAARKDRVQGSVVMAVVVDSEGCPLTAKVLKPLPQRQADQAEATWKWWAYQPASYEKHPVGLKYNLTFGFAVQ